MVGGDFNTFFCTGDENSLPVFDDRVIPAISDANQAGWNAYEKLTNEDIVGDWRMDLELSCQTTDAKHQGIATLKLEGRQYKVNLSF